MPKTVHNRSPRVLAFIDDYVWGPPGVAGNATECAVRAGFCSTSSRGNSGDYGCQVLRRKHVAAIIEKEQAEKKRQLKAKSMLVAERLYKKAMEDSDVPASIAFLKYAGEMSDKVEVSGSGGGPISVVFNLAPPRE